MSESLPFSALPRGTLLPLHERLDRLTTLAPSLAALTAEQRDPIAVMATVAACVWQALPQCNWVGFYRRVEPSLLRVGPYQGGLGCLEISFERGVCGACARTGKPQRVEDIRTRPDHIACDGATLSELVLPVLAADGTLCAVFDLDSPHLAGFDDAESSALAALLTDAFAVVRWEAADWSPR